ncbi:hypothetical protein [Cytobacillus purgationiresistens]|uniref:Uncharacterized protein n=1 Tax=Cytobacillus purgationiresistens TaxID=863449 RepID=A0ABU0ADX2_9BACI|nr:hypothetical protein [Cytobacillus purgationiresistens]MDQ0269446.1 hypothetical protein [Cytobacillus purgationiresistens]
MKIIEPAQSFSEQFSNPIQNSKLILTPGLWIDGHTHWLDSGMEKIFAEKGISIRIKEMDIHSKVRFYKLYVTNHDQNNRKVKLLMAHRYIFPVREHVSFISPSENVIYHVADKKTFLINGHLRGNIKQECTVQPYWNVYNDQIWSHNDKSVLKYHPMVKGHAVSIYAHNVDFQGKESIEGEAWVISDMDKNELIDINHALLKNILAIQTEK